MSSFLRGSQENSVMFLMKTIARSTMYRNLSFTSLQEMWNRNPLSIFLKRLPFISTNWKQIKMLKNKKKNVEIKLNNNHISMLLLLLHVIFFWGGGGLYNFQNIMVTGLLYNWHYINVTLSNCLINH